jgi:hypothetical protein
MSFPSKQTIPRCDKLIFRPCKPIADHIVSHSIDTRLFIAIMDHYSLGDAEVLTKYYVLDHILCIRQDRRVECSVSYTQATYSDIDTELVAISQFELSSMCFPLNHTFDHERQMIVLRRELETEIVLELEILVTGIRDPRQRFKELPAILELIRDDCSDHPSSDSGSGDEDLSPDPFISLSYNLITTPSKYDKALEYLGALRGL